jgi:hypothetical protein
VHEARTLVSKEVASEGRAETLAVFAGILAGAGHLRQAVDLASEAIDVAVEAKARQIEGRAKNTKGIASSALGSAKSASRSSKKPWTLRMRSMTRSRLLVRTPT